MEIRARYVLMGLFSIAVIVAVFVFVYWLENAGGLRQRASYQIRFQNPVSGLLVGSAVFFNGINVGEVTDLKLDPDHPRWLTAIIEVDQDVPIRADTKVGVEYQGLTGGAAILLKGGKASAPPLSSDQSPPLIAAQPMAGRNWTEAAGDVLGRVDTILQDNSESLHATIDNLTKFSDVLARNSDRIDGIIIGLERMTGGKEGKPQIPTYDLTAPDKFPPAGKPGWQIMIPQPTVLLAFNTDKIIKRTGPEASVTLEDGRWSDNVPNMLQAKILRSFENAGYMRSVVGPADEASPDYRLVIDLRSFELSANSSPAGTIDFVAKIFDKDGKVVAAKQFHASAAAKSADAAAAAAALDDAFAKVVTELVTWTVASI